MYRFSFAYEVILKETQPKVGLSKSSGSDQKQTHYVYVRAPFDVRAAIGASLGAKIVFFGAASNIALTSPSSWKEFSNSSKVASDDGLSIEL